MADKPQEPTWVRNNQDVRKYVCLFTIALIAFNSLFTCFVMFVMPSKEITVKLFDTGDESKTKIILEHRVGDADTANNAGIHDNIDTIMTKLSKLEADGKVYKELKMKIEKLEDQLNENLFPNTCDEKESTCSDHGDNFKTFMTEIKKDVDMEIKSKLAELQIHIDANELGQKSSTDSGSTWEYFMMKLAEMESHFTTRDETKQKTTELEQRIDDVQALIDEKKPVFTSPDGEAEKSTSYLKLFMRVFLWIIGFAIFAFAVFGICLAINGFMQKNFPRKDEWLLVYGGLLCCVTVVCTVVHFTYVYAMCGRQELFVSLEKLLFT